MGNGRIPETLANLVDTDCSNAAGCNANIELIALFFQSDGTLEVEGTVVLGIEGDDASRRLAKVETLITRSNEYPDRGLSNDAAVAVAPVATMGMSVSVLSDPSISSGSISFGPSSSYIVVSLMTLLISVTMMVANDL